MITEKDSLYSRYIKARCRNLVYDHQLFWIQYENNIRNIRALGGSEILNHLQYSCILINTYEDQALQYIKSHVHRI